MRKIFVILLLIISLIYNPSLVLAQSGLPATSVRTTDGKNVQTHLNNLYTQDGAITAEALLLSQKVGQVFSSGKISGGEFTYDGGSGIDYTTMEVVLKTSNSETAPTQYFLIPSGKFDTAGQIASNEVGILYLDYNNGTPQILVTTDRTTIRKTDQFDLVRFYKNQNTIYIGTYGFMTQNFGRREHERTSARGVAERMTGAIIAEKATRYLTITASTWYGGTSYVAKNASDSSVDGFEHYYSYNSSTQTWTDNIGSYPNQIENTKYNRTSDGTLQNLTNNQYGVHWIYLGGSSKLSVIFGSNSYKLNEAEAIQPPSTLPVYLAKFSTLVGKVIVQKNASTFTEVASAFDNPFTVTTAEHNDLINRDAADAHPGSSITYTDTYNMGVTNAQTAIDTLSVKIDSINYNLLANIGTLELKLNADILALANNLSTHEIRIDSVENYILTWLPTTTEAGYLYYDTTEAKVKWQMVQSGGTGVTDHTLLSNIGTKTHAQLEIDISGMQSAISALQANPGGLTGLSVNGGIAFTGEVKLTAGSNVTLTQTGNTVEVSATSNTAEVNFVEHLNYISREQGTAEVGYYSVYFFNLPVANTVLNSISVYMNGIKQYKEGGVDCVISTWTDNDVVKYKVIFNKNVEAVSSVWISYFTGVTSVEYSDIWIPYFNDVAKEQGTSEIGYFSILKFNVSEAELLTSSVQYMENGLVQTPNVDYVKTTWNDGGTIKIQITLTNHSISAIDEIAISFVRPNVSLANIADSYISTNRMGSSTVNEALQSAEVKLIALQTEIDSLENALSSAGGKAIEDVGTYISDNKTWEFSTNYDTSCVLIYRNRLLQPRSLFTSSLVSNKIRVSFLTAIDASDEICLISSK